MLVRVRAFPDSKREKVVREKEGEYIMYVREPAARNEANRRILALIAKAEGVPLGAVRLRTGHRSPKKTLEILTFS